MKKYQGILLDGDGVLWKANQPLPGLHELFQYLDQEGIPWALLTNNNGHPVSAYLDRFEAYGIEAGVESIFTSSTVTADYLLEEYGSQACFHVIGLPGLTQALEEAGLSFSLGEEQPDQPVDAVVVGMDLDLTYRKLTTAMRLILEGADFVATNIDANYPRPDGIYPATGAVTGALVGTTRVEPYVVGKPYPAIFQAALEQLGVQPEQALMVGDQLDTDIQGANQAGIDSAAVLTGITSREQIQKSQVKPTFVIEDLPALLEALRKGS